jgi:threonine/homoserine/homoserine lactone efflux protein
MGGSGSRHYPDPFLLIVVPGPSVLFVTGGAPARGGRAALTTVLGNTVRLSGGMSGHR